MFRDVPKETVVGLKSSVAGRIKYFVINGSCMQATKTANLEALHVSRVF